MFGEQYTTKGTGVLPGTVGGTGGGAAATSSTSMEAGGTVVVHASALVTSHDDDDPRAPLLVVSMLPVNVEELQMGHALLLRIATLQGWGQLVGGRFA